MTPVPFAASPVLPLLQAIFTSLILTFGASMLRHPVMFWQLMTVFAVVMRIVRVVVPEFVTSPDGQDEARYPVLSAAGQPQSARWLQT